jgi:hypothetical protein
MPIGLIGPHPFPMQVAQAGVADPWRRAIDSDDALGLPAPRAAARLWPGDRRPAAARVSAHGRSHRADQSGAALGSSRQ